MAIFRYLTYEGGKATLANGTLKATPPVEFNDPFDMLPAFNFRLTAENSQQGNVDRTADEMEWERSFNDSALDSFRAHSNEIFRAVCFSRIKNSLPMWGYYCSSHTGLVIEFDEHDELFRNQFGRNLKEINYVPVRPSFTQQETDDLALMYAKAKGWAHEKEVRLIESLRTGRMIEGQINREKAWFLRFPKSAVKAIYFGCRMTDDQRHEIASNMANWGYDQVRLVEMHPHPDRFELVERNYVPKKQVECRPKAPAHQIDENSTPAEVMAHIIERIISKRGAPDSCEDKSLAASLEWALAEVKDMPTQIPWLESLCVDPATERILVRDEPA